MFARHFHALAALERVVFHDVIPIQGVFDEGRDFLPEMPFIHASFSVRAEAPEFRRGIDAVFLEEISRECFARFHLGEALLRRDARDADAFQRVREPRADRVIGADHGECRLFVLRDVDHGGKIHDVHRKVVLRKRPEAGIAIRRQGNQFRLLRTSGKSFSNRMPASRGSYEKNFHEIRSELMAFSL